MKKSFNILVASLMLAGLALTSCNKEEADIFDASAADRLSAAASDYRKILSDKGGKWQFEYFANANEPGYVFVMNFAADKSVNIQTNNLLIAQMNDPRATTPQYGSDNSTWDVITDDGPVLTFDTYSKYFHMFSTPEESPIGTGHGGDFEFNIMKYSNDTLYLEGKKTKIKMIMTRLDASIDDKLYLQQTVAQADSFFNAKIPSVYLTLPNGKRYVVTDGASMIITFYPEGTRPEFTKKTMNAIITLQGLTLQSPLTLDSVYTVQHFTRQADGSLLCTDDGKSIINAGPLSKLLASPITWNIDLIGATGKFAGLYTAANEGLQNASPAWLFKTGNPKYLQLFEGKSLNLDVRMKLNAGTQQTLVYPYAMNVIDDNTVKLQFGESAGWSDKLYKEVPNLRALIDAIGNSTFTVKAKNTLAPTTVTLVDKDDPNSTITLTL